MQTNSAGIYLLKVKNRNTITRWRHSGVFIVNFGHISHHVLHVIAGWELIVHMLMVSQNNE